MGVEAALRLALDDPRSVAPAKVLDADYGWRVEGNSLSQVSDLHGEQKVRRWTNSLGFNDVDHDTARPNGVRRILFVGDSFTEGGFPLEASFVKQVERALIDGGGRWECVNMGMGGFSTAQEFKMWEKLGSLFDPEIVIVMFCVDNDVSDNHPGLSQMGSRPYFLFQDGKMKFEPMDVAAAQAASDARRKKKRPWYSAWLYRTYFWTIKRSASVQLRARMRRSPELTRIMRSMGFWKPKKLNRDWEQFLSGLPADQQTVWDEAFDATAEIIRKFDRATRERNQKLLLVFIPSQVQVYDNLKDELQRFFVNFDAATTDLGRPTRVLREKLAGDSVALMDLLPAMRSYSGPDRLYYRHDGHFSTAGHREAGLAITAELHRLGWTQ